MVAWILQRMGKVPAVGNVWAKVLPGATTPLSNASPVTVWSTESLLVNVTVPPTATVTSAGSNEALVIETLTALGAALVPDPVPDPDGVDGVDGAAEHPATSNSEARAATRSTLRIPRMTGSLRYGTNGTDRFLPESAKGDIPVEERAIERTCVMPEALPMPEPGDAAPIIDAEMTGGGRFALAEHVGHWVVVYFYPRANTPG